MKKYEKEKKRKKQITIVYVRITPCVVLIYSNSIIIHELYTGRNIILYCMNRPVGMDNLVLVIILDIVHNANYQQKNLPKDTCA